MSYKITDEQKKALLQYSAQTLPDNPSREGFSAESIRKRMYKPIEKLIDLVNSVFDTAYTDVKSIITAIQSGDLFARSVASWSASYTYGADEITFYPSIGTYGAFVQSVVAGNTNNAPYVDGAINSAYWKEVVNFNTVTEDYFQQIQQAVTEAENAASEAEGSAQAAANSATQAGIQNSNAQSAAFNASQSAQAASNSATAASTSASQSAASATQSQNSANQSGTYASNAQTSAQNAADSATAAQGYAQQAQQYAQKHYQVVASVSELPRPGDSAFIYLVPTGSGTSNDSYSEYLWITESNDYEFIGTTADIDLSNYAQINGTYAGMTVGNATNATNADTADSATSAQDSAKLGGVAASQYAQIAQIPSNVIAVESLPTATADSPDFVQTPDGKLYRKKTIVDSSILAGTWRFNDMNWNNVIDKTINVNFSSNNEQFIGFKGSTTTGTNSGDQEFEYYTLSYLKSGSDFINAYQYGWDGYFEHYNGWSTGYGETYRIVTFAEGTVNSEALSFMQSNAVKQSVYSYEEVGASGNGVVDIGSLREGANTISSELSQKVMDESCTIVKFELSNVVGQDIYCTRSIEVPTENGVAFSFTMADDDNTIRTYGITVKGTTVTLMILDVNAGGTTVEFATVDECAEAFNPTTVTLISFKVANNTYTAESGMTWQQFVNSSYNENGQFSISGSGVFWTGRDILAVTSNDEIVDDMTYGLGSGGSIN